MTIPAEHYVLRDVTSPRGVVRVLRDHWWWCINDNPSKAVFYVGVKRKSMSPQCNRDRRIVERIPVPFETATICQIPIAFVPHEDLS